MAWTQFTDEWGPRLYGYLQHNLFSVSAIRNILGEIMSAVVRLIPKFDGHISLPLFIYSVASQIITEMSQKKISSSSSDRVTESTTDFQDNQFHRQLSQLPDQIRQAMILRYRLNFNIQEISLILGKSFTETQNLLAQGIRPFEHTIKGQA